MNTLIRIRAIGLFCCLLLTHWAFSQTTRYVSTTGITPAASATSWAASTTDLQGAIAASQPGDQVWVATGTYTPASGSSFSMRPGVTIYGGFAGGETDLSQRPAVNPVTTGGRPGNPSNTTLAGNGSRVITNPASLSLTTTAGLDGFVITEGRSNQGGGMYNNGSSPTLTNCLFVANQATGSVTILGGAMANINSNPVLTNCLFVGNQVTGGGQNFGGAMFNSSSSPLLANCSFENNQATGGQGNFGGAMYNTTSSNPVLTNCSFQSNQATGGTLSSNQGGAMYNRSNNPVLTNCSFQGNQAMGSSYNEGGAMFNSGSNPVLTNCVLWNNGGGNTFYNISSTLTARYSLFDASVTDYSGSNNLTATTSPFGSATSVALAPCSPAINAGDPNTTTATVGTTDLAGNVRFFGGRIDMGAVEYQARLYVAASQTANVGDGQSWDTAFPDLQSALTYPCSQSLTEIWVAQGTYKPASGSSFSMLPGVAIYGGFRGTETSLSERPSVNPVTTEGRPGHPSNTTLAGNGSRVITNPSGLTTTAMLDGFVITEGQSNQGGGMYNISSSPVLTNCLFQSNQATGISGTKNGGAIYNTNSNPVLTNCSFLGNQVTGELGGSNGGGAMYNTNSKPVLINCSFESNQVTGGGTASNYGGAMYNENSRPVLTNCLFQSNQATGSSISINYGGAMYNLISNPVLTNCSFQSNQVTGGSLNYGGAMYNISSSNPVLTNCVLWNNGGANTFYTAISSTLTARYSLFDNTTGVDVTGPGNLTATTSPFVSTTGVALVACSPAINAGNPESQTVVSGPYSATTLPATDLTGSPRINSTRIDMGAVEYQNQTGVPLQIVQQPVASSVVCAQSNVVMSVSVTGSAPAYQWYRSGTALTGIASATTASLTLTNVQTTDAGSYSVVISGDCPSVTSTAFSLSVNALPSVTVTAAPSATLSCTNPSLTLTAQTSATAFSWSSGGSTGQTLPLSQTGTYSVTVTDGNGCAAVSNSLSISRDNTSPTVSVSALSTMLTCTQPQLTLTATASATGLLWSTGQTTTTIAVSTTGVYSVTATGANGCSAVSNSLSISRDNTSPTVSISAISNQLTCTQPQLTLTATASVTALRWSTGQTTTTISVSQTGTYSVTATGANGCSAVSNNLSVTENFSLPPFTVSSATVCLGQSVNLTASGCSGLVLWPNGATGSMITLTAGSSTSLLTATCTVGSCSTTASGQVVVGGIQPPPAQILSFTADESACPVRLTGRGVATSFTMVGPKGYVFSTVYREGATHEAIGLNVKQAGTYTLTATYTNSCGTSAPVTRTVTVNRNCP